MSNTMMAFSTGMSVRGSLPIEGQAQRPLYTPQSEL